MSISGVSVILMLMAFHVSAKTEFLLFSPDPELNVVMAVNSISGIEYRHLIALPEEVYESSETCYTSITTSVSDLSLTSSDLDCFLYAKSEESAVLKRPSGETQVGNSSESMRVLWTVAGYLLGPQAVLDDDQARALIFTPLDMTDDSISFAGRVCKPISFSRTTSRLSDYLSAAHGISPQDLNLEDQSVQIINTTCDIPGFSEFLRLKDMRIVVTIDGVFYFLEPLIFR